jgi:hypothetical protein
MPIMSNPQNRTKFTFSDSLPLMPDMCTQYANVRILLRQICPPDISWIAAVSPVYMAGGKIA